MEWNFEQILWPVSIFAGILMCKIIGYYYAAFCLTYSFLLKVYEITGFVSSFFKGYVNLSKAEMIEWNNRGFSTFHAVLIAAISFYLVMLSDLFKDELEPELVVNRKSAISDAAFGISIGYFLADLGMIIWLFPALGGKEYILHHGLSLYSIILALISGKAHVYILMVLFSEITTPFVNLRWYLDRVGAKNSSLYLWNGVALFLGWLVARIILFMYFFTHMYLHFDEVKTIFPLGFYSLLTAPSMLAVMNLFWFWKIFKGMKKAITRKKHRQ